MAGKPYFFNFVESSSIKKIQKLTIDPQILLDRMNIGKNVTARASPTVLILTKKTDIESDLVGIKLLKHGIDYVKITEEDIPLNFGFKFDTRTNEKSILYLRNRRINPRNIKIVLFRYFDLKFLNYYTGIFQAFFAQQWYQAFNCLRLTLDSTWINDSQKTFDSENRLRQLVTAQKIGLSIPETSITNSILEGKKFLKRNPKSIMKVLHHHEITLKHRSFKFLTNNMEADHLLSFEDLVYAPVIFQRKIENDSEIRVTVVGDKIFSCKLSINDKNKYSDLHKIEESKIIFEEINLGKKMEKLCIKLNRELGLLVSSIDFVQGKNGEFFFLEINPIGDWYWIEKRTNLPITKSMFDFVNGILSKRGRT
jgi:glutathione synthase/RimK-type ligase-like ATP-grasp enzyme